MPATDQPPSSTPPTLVQYEAGEHIIAAGERGDRAYLIESGQVEIFVEAPGQPISIRCLKPGNVLGEMAVIDDAPRSASARALGPTRCVVISREQIAERIDELEPVVRLLLNTLLDRMRTLTLGGAQVHRSDTSSAVTPPSPAAVDTAPMPVRHRKADAAAIEKMRFESELRTAIASDGLIPNYQPLVELRSGRLVGFELLVRWHSSSRGQISPGQFIALAEETALIIPVGCWALRTAVQTLQAFQSQRHAKGALPFISVNISAKQFLSPDFLDRLETLVPAPMLHHSPKTELPRKPSWDLLV